MINGKDKTIEKVNFLLLTFAYSLTLIMPNDTAGSVIMLICFLFVWLFNKRQLGKTPLVFDSYIKLTIIFVGMCFLSLIWSIDKELSLAQCRSVLQTVIMFWILYSAMVKDCDVNILLRAIMWGSYIACIYAFCYFGVDNLMALGAEGERMDSTYVNSNVIGMSASLSIIISLYFQLYQKKSLSILINIIPFILLTASGSRKALVSLILGGSLLFISKNKTKNKFVFILRMCVVIVLLFFVVKAMLSLPMFNTLNTRMEGMVDAFLGEAEADRSSLIRAELRNIGFMQFLSTPFTGVGIDCPRYLAIRFTGDNYYLHCNYAELLAGIGLFGCLSFYAVYIYGIRNLWKKRYLKDSLSYVVSTMILIQLITDYGCVSYYERNTYFLIVAMLLQVKRLNVLSTNYNK